MHSSNGKHDILCYAQFFGYAPTAELLVVLTRLQQHANLRFTVIDNGMIEDLYSASAYSANPPQILRPENGLSVRDFLRQEQLHDSYELLFSSYDPMVVMYGWFHNIRTVFYDGVYFLWQYQTARVVERLAQLQELRLYQQETEFWQKYDGFFSENPYEAAFLAHLVSTVNLVRKDDNELPHFREFPLLRRKTIEIGAILNNGIQPMQTCDNSILVSLSGSLSPLLSFAQNMRYARDILHLTQKLRDKLPEYKYTYICNPKVAAELAKDVPPGIELLSSVTPERFHLLVQNAWLLLLSPTISTLEIAAYVETPIFLLPEQQGSHPGTIRLLKKHGYSTDFGLNLTEHVYGGETILGEEQTARMCEEVHELLTGEKFWPVVEQQLSAIPLLLADSQRYRRLVDQQRQAILRKVGDFEGAAAISETIARYVFAEKKKR